jgi:hypothetical protein
MAGIRVFKTLGEALRAGYHVYDKSPTGHLVRIRIGTGWALAIVDHTQ